MVTKLQATANKKGCLKCNTVQDPGNDSGKTYACSVYCDAQCNSDCETAQSFCSVDYQLIRKHPDVGDYPMKEANQNVTYIDELWTVANFSKLIARLDGAEKAGYKQTQGASYNVDKPVSGTNITADFYNDIRKKIINFNVDYPSVKSGDIITAESANAIKEAYEAAKFNTNVCDICNTAEYYHPGCGCNCSCSCSCGCSCSCDCSCDCPCDCDNPCSCSSNTGS